LICEIKKIPVSFLFLLTQKPLQRTKHHSPQLPINPAKKTLLHRPKSPSTSQEIHLKKPEKKIDTNPQKLRQTKGLGIKD